MKQLLFIFAFSLLLSSAFSVNAGGVNIGGGKGFVDTSNKASTGVQESEFNPLNGKVSSLQGFAGQLIQAGLGVVGSLALIMFVYSGFRWMTAQGNAKAIEESQKTMLWAALGLVLIFSSYALVKFVIGAAGG